MTDIAWMEGTGNPARRCRLTFKIFECEIQTLILLWWKFCVKLEYKDILTCVKCSGSTLSLINQVNNGENGENICGLLEPGWGWFPFGKEVTLNGLHH